MTPGLCVRVSPSAGQVGNKLASVSSAEIFTVKHLLNSLYMKKPGVGRNRKCSFIKTHCIKIFFQLMETSGRDLVSDSDICSPVSPLHLAVSAQPWQHVHIWMV